jgi:hypothetical protein
MAGSVYQNADGTWSATNAQGQVVFTGPNNQDAQNAYIMNQPGGTSTQNPTANYGFTSPYPTTGGYSSNLASDDVATRASAMAATRAYQEGMIQNLGERLAFDKAVQAYTETYQKAMALGSFGTGQQTLTYGNTMGTMNGNPTLANQEAMGMIGGQPTLAGQEALGTFNGQPTLASQQTMGVDRWGNPTLAAQGQRNTNAIGYLGLLKGMTGPANAFDYAGALTGTPGGLADIVRAAGGQYQMPSSGGGNGQPITPLSIGSMINDVNRYSPTAGGSATASSAGGYGVTAANPVLASLQSAGVPAFAKGGTSAPGMPVMGQGTTPYTTNMTPTTPATTSGSSYVPQYGAVPQPNQISPQNYAAMTPSQKDLLMQAYGQAGWNTADVQSIFGQSLKGYGGPSSGLVGF